MSKTQNSLELQRKELELELIELEIEKLKLERGLVKEGSYSSEQKHSGQPLSRDRYGRQSRGRYGRRADDPRDASLSLILALVAICIFPLFGLILGAPALAVAQQVLKNPSFEIDEYQKARAGKIISIIAIVLCSLFWSVCTFGFLGIFGMSGLLTLYAGGSRPLQYP